MSPKESALMMVASEAFDAGSWRREAEASERMAKLGALAGAFAFAAKTAEPSLPAFGLAATAGLRAALRSQSRSALALSVLDLTPEDRLAFARAVFLAAPDAEGVNQIQNALADCDLLVPGVESWSQEPPRGSPEAEATRRVDELRPLLKDHAADHPLRAAWAWIHAGADPERVSDFCRHVAMGPPPRGPLPPRRPSDDLLCQEAGALFFLQNTQRFSADYSEAPEARYCSMARALSLISPPRPSTLVDEASDPLAPWRLRCARELFFLAGSARRWAPDSNGESRIRLLESAFEREGAGAWIEALRLQEALRVSRHEDFDATLGALSSGGFPGDPAAAAELLGILHHSKAALISKIERAELELSAPPPPAGQRRARL